MRLIDANALRNKICAACAERLVCNDMGNICFEVACIDNAPTIEPEVRHGRWIHGDALDYKDPNGVIHVHGMCSRCRLIYDFRDMTSRFKFCPNCGAKMYADGGTISKERFEEIMRGADNG